MSDPGELLFNPADPRFNADPYVEYRRIRARAPIHWNRLGAWVLSRHQDVRFVLRDHRFQVRDIPAGIERKQAALRKCSGVAAEASGLGALLRSTRCWLSFLDAPHHTRIRDFVSPAFHPRMVEALRPWVRRAAWQLLERARHDGVMDVISQFAKPLPARVIAALLEVPDADIARLVDWSERFARILDPLLPLEELPELERAALEFERYLTCHLEKRGSGATDSLLGVIRSVGADGDCLSEAEIIGTLILLFCAGSETTTNFFGNGLLALLRNPDRLEQLRHGPDLLAAAVEELLRYDSPLQMTSRIAKTAVTLRGQTIGAGQQVYLLIGAANRDPEEFTGPDEIDFHRPRNRHLCFAAGPHTCLGASLARLEAQEGLRVLLQGLPGLSLVETSLEWRPHIVLRGLRRLRVRFATSSPGRLLQ